MKNKKNLLIILLIVVIIVLILIYFLFLRTKSFTVTFDTDGGSTINNVLVKDGEILDISNKPIKEGFTFVGWANSEGRIITKNTRLTKNITLKAIWVDNKSEKVTIKFSTDGGNSIDDITLSKDEKIILPVDPVREGYIFMGWMNSDGNIISEDMVLSSDMKLTAYWIKDGVETSKITFDTDGGNNIKEIIVEKGKTVKLPVPPKKDGYVFVGWLLPDGNVVTKDTIINNDTTLKSKLKLPYVCPENCTPSEDGSTCTREVTVSLSKTTACPNGYTLKSGKCLNYKTKYLADNIDKAPYWKCKNSSDYMYTEEEAGGALMWCVKTTSKVTNESCPSGYTNENNTCKKTETVNCTLSQN